MAKAYLRNTERSPEAWVRQLEQLTTLPPPGLVLPHLLLLLPPLAVSCPSLCLTEEVMDVEGKQE